MTFLSTMDFLCPIEGSYTLKALQHAILQGFYIGKQKGLQKNFS